MRAGNPGKWLLSGVVLALFLAAGCGSDSSGGGGAPAANLDDSNGASIGQQSVSASSYGEMGNSSVTNLSAVDNDAMAVLPLGAINQALKQSIADLARGGSDTPYGGQEVKTIDGTCGGTATFIGDYSTTSMDGSVTYSMFCVGGMYFNGGISFTGTFDGSGDPTYLDISYNQLTFTGQGYTFVFNGTAVYKFTSSVTTATLNLSFDMGTYSFSCEDYVMTDEDLGGNEHEISFSGRLYFSTYGYVDLDTITVFTYDTTTPELTGGVLRVTGADPNAPMYVEADNDGSPGYTMWIDANGNGTQDSGEEVGTGTWF